MNIFKKYTLKDKWFLFILVIAFLMFIFFQLAYGNEKLFFIFISFFAIFIAVMQLEIYRRIEMRFKEQNWSYRQIESLFSLFSILKFRKPLPQMRSWAISPDLANILYSIMIEEKPEYILDLGSGISSLIAGYCAEKNSLGQIISIDHDSEFAKKTSDIIHDHDLMKSVSVKVAPLKPISVKGKEWLWYDISVLEKNAKPIDLLIVDGPPDRLQDLSRYPALPLLYKYLNNEATIILDDTNGEQEKNIVRLWKEEFPGLDIREENTEKGAIIIKVKK